MCESMLGIHPIETSVDKRKLMFVRKLINLEPTTLPKQVLLRRLNMYMFCRHVKSTGFAPNVIRLFNKYGLSHYLQTILHSSPLLPQKQAWNRLVNEAVDRYANCARAQRMASDHDFNRFRHLHLSCNLAQVCHFPKRPGNYSLPTMSLAYG